MVGTRSPAVYCYYDPDLASLSIGTYSILTQLRLAAQWGMRHVYLGLYIAENAHMAYKARFLPHERLIAPRDGDGNGEWREFERLENDSPGSNGITPG